MEPKTRKVILITISVLLIILIPFYFYYKVVRPHVVGSYKPTSKDCKQAYNCKCINNDCLCYYKKWFNENQLSCSKDTLSDKQMK